MASAKKEENKAPVQGPVQGPPEGFQQGGRPDIDGWFKNEVGTVVHGKLVGHIEIPGRKGKRDVVVIQLLSPCIAYQQGDKEGKILEPGSNLGVGVGHDLSEILDYVENKGQVWFRPTEKKDLKGGNTMWKYEQYYKGRKAPLVRSTTAQSSSDGEDEDIPF